MNEVNIQKFLEQTEQYLRTNNQDIPPEELNDVIELYEDLTEELNRQQLAYDLYN